MSSELAQLRQKCALAEEQLAQVQQELERLQVQVGQKNGSVTTKSSLNQEDEKSESSSPSKKDSNNNKKSAPAIELPFDLIDDEAVLISEKGKEATMCVTICNGESNPPFISSKGINWLKNNFNSNEKDVFVDTYAKCGTTLCIKLVYQIFNAVGRVCSGASGEDMSSPWNAVPWIEVDVSQEIKKKGVDTPNDFVKFINDSNSEKNNVRIWKSHAPFVNFPASSIGNGSKIIHVTRNPKDVICSYFNFFQKEPFVSYKGDFNTLFDWFCDGSVVHSNFWDFELAWYRAAQQNKDKILWITFEEIVRIPDVAIRKVAKFLNVELNADQVKHIAYEISFDKMKADASKSIAGVLMNKGTIGRWQSMLSDEQSSRMDRISNCRFSGTGIEFDYGTDEERAKELYRKLSIGFVDNPTF